MWPNYSCCDFCPYDSSQCEGCSARDAEVKLNRMISGLPEDPYDPWDEEDIDDE